MKKSIWIILPIVIVAVVLVAVFIGQRNTLSDQVAQLQAERSDLTRQLNEADIAAKTAQELAESNRLAMEEKVQEAESRIQEAETMAQEAESRIQEAQNKAEEAEGKVQEAVEALSVATTERDALQANANIAAEQLAGSIKQVQDALSVLGVTQDEDAVAAELEETKAALTAVTDELNAFIADSDAKAAQAAQELQQVQDALSAVTYERDQLQSALEATASQTLELENLQNRLAEVSAERVAVAVAATAASILDASENVVMTFENVSDLKLAELSLQPGAYTIRIMLLNAAGGEISHYDLPYTVAAEAE